MPLFAAGTSSKVTRAAACCARGEHGRRQRTTKQRLKMRRTAPCLFSLRTARGLPFGRRLVGGLTVRRRLRRLLRARGRLPLLLLGVEPLDGGALALGVGVALELVVEAREQDVRGREVGLALDDALQQFDGL